MFKNQKKLISSESFFILVLFVFTGVIIYKLLSNSQILLQHVVNASATNISADVISSIMNATDNAINKIYNIIVITTVYITVIITTFSLFQYIKSKEIEATKNELQGDIIELKNKIENDRANLNIEVDEKIKEMNSILNEVKKEALKTSNMTRIDFLAMKAETEKNKNNYFSKESAINAYKEIFSIIEDYPIEDKRKAEYFNYYAILIAPKDVGEAEEYYQKAIEITQDEGLKSIYYTNLGLLKLDNKYYDKAIDFFEKAENINELNLESQKFLILTLDKRNEDTDIDKAFLCIKKMRSYVELDVAKAFFQLINGYKISNVQAKYENELNIIANEYIEKFPDDFSVSNK
jgi:tetratricopeptide (TPR) repeat protein